MMGMGCANDVIAAAVVLWGVLELLFLGVTMLYLAPRMNRLTSPPAVRIWGEAAKLKDGSLARYKGTDICVYNARWAGTHVVCDLQVVSSCRCEVSTTKSPAGRIYASELVYRSVERHYHAIVVDLLVLSIVAPEIANI